MSTIKSSDEHLTLNADGTSKDIKLQSNASEKVIIKSDGKVGIGETSPQGTLHVKTSDSGATAVAGADDLIVEVADYGGISILSENEGHIYFGDNEDADVGRIEYQHSENNMVFRTNASDALTINSSGNVGIGTLSPDSSLEIYKASTAELMIGSDNGGTAQISLYESNSTTKEAIIKYDGFANNLVIGTSGEANAIVIPRDSGNVGIGVTPEAWHSSWTALQLGATGFVGQYQGGGSDITGLGSNVYSDGTYKYLETDEAAIIRLSDGEIIFSVAASGSADAAITWKDTLTLDSGNVSNFRRYDVLNSNFERILAFKDGSGTERGNIKINNANVQYNTSSDYRLKENVNYTWDATTRLKQLKPARFNWITDDTNTLVDGFIAHEVQTIVPEAVSGNKDAMMNRNIYDANGNVTGTESVIDPQGIDQSKLVPLLVKTIQELEARITELENA